MVAEEGRCGGLCRMVSGCRGAEQGPHHLFGGVGCTTKVLMGGKGR